MLLSELSSVCSHLCDGRYRENEYWFHKFIEFHRLYLFLTVSSVLSPSTSCCMSLNRAFCVKKITGTAIALDIWQRSKMKFAVFSNHTCSETNLFYESCKESLNCHWEAKGIPLSILCASACNFSVSYSYLLILTT